MGKYFGTDGIRGIAYEYLSAEIAEKLGVALGYMLLKENGQPTVVIGGDTRESYSMLLEALCAGLTRMGVCVHIAGTVPTPAVAYFTANCGFDCGVMISASHNPYEYNGIKILGKGGFKLSDEKEIEVENLMDNAINLAENHTRGRIINNDELLFKYVDYLAKFSPKLNKRLLAVIDCANGSASATAKKVFSFLGKDTMFIGDAPNGKNINDGCGSTHLSLLSKKVVENGYDIGLAFDGDADRFLAVDEGGRQIDGDTVLAILAEDLRERGRLYKNTVVGTVTTNYGFEEFARKNGYNFLTARVGDRYVLEEMERGGYSLGGEQSGHTIIREAATTGDGQLTALYVIARMAKTGKKLSELAGVFNKYPQYTENITISEEGKLIIKSDKRIQAVIDDAKSRLGGNGRILVRASGTEPVVRILIESLDENTARSVCGEVTKKIKNILDGN